MISTLLAVLIILTPIVVIPACIAVMFWMLIQRFPCPMPAGATEATTHQRIWLVEQQLTQFWRLVERSLATRLHAPTHHRMDALLLKLQDNTITIDECRELRFLIQERAEELVVEGMTRPDLEFPRLMTIWAIDVRLVAVDVGAVAPEAPKVS